MDKNSMNDAMQVSEVGGTGQVPNRQEVSEARQESASVAGASDAPAQRCEGLARANEYKVSRLSDGWVRGVDKDGGRRLPPDDDPVAQHLRAVWWLPRSPLPWHAERLNGAAWLFEREDGVKVVAKLFRDKSPNDVDRNAAREARILTLLAPRLSAPAARLIPSVFELWRGVLFLEFQSGDTLQRLAEAALWGGQWMHSPLARPSTAQDFARALASLHGLQEERFWRNVVPHEGLAQATRYAEALLTQLAERGLLHQGEASDASNDEASRSATALRLGISRHRDLAPRLCLVHGDMTTGNVLWDQGEGLSLIDWERAKWAPPELDWGRLRAELRHLVRRFVGSPQASVSRPQQVELRAWNQGHGSDPLSLFLHASLAAYSALGPSLDQRLLDFYDATSSLRIARNGWLSREQRLEAVDDALQLLHVDA
ncbi:MAG: aminoglycoside phosphotransferase family protein [Myxococcota bacterium]|jgi:aminoglycoside phosphotransferase (APT) family kinase protein|nr:aminoglycoside phosphotransferase family protein [Myxococcota bacterium]